MVEWGASGGGARLRGDGWVEVGGREGAGDEMFDGYTCSKGSSLCVFFVGEWGE